MNYLSNKVRLRFGCIYCGANVAKGKDARTVKAAYMQLSNNVMFVRGQREQLVIGFRVWDEKSAELYLFNPEYLHLIYEDIYNLSNSLNVHKVIPQGYALQITAHTIHFLIEKGRRSAAGIHVCKSLSF